MISAVLDSEKQSQFKAKQTQFYLAPRPALGVEKTKPRKVLPMFRLAQHTSQRENLRFNAEFSLQHDISGHNIN